MTKEEAQAECARLEREHPDRERLQFLVREGANGEWTVVDVALPGGVRRATATGTSTEPPPEAPPSGPDTKTPIRPYMG